MLKDKKNGLGRLDFFIGVFYLESRLRLLLFPFISGELLIKIEVFYGFAGLCGLENCVVMLAKVLLPRSVIVFGLN